MWKEVLIKGINPNTPTEMVEEVFRKYGEVKELKFAEMDGIRYNEASLLVNTEEGTRIPVFVFASDQEGEFKERWEVVYRGRPRVCYGCYQPGHNRGDCLNEQLTYEALRDGGNNTSWAQVARGPGRQEQLVQQEEVVVTGAGRQEVETGGTPVENDVAKYVESMEGNMGHGGRTT